MVGAGPNRPGPPPDPISFDRLIVDYSELKVKNTFIDNWVDENSPPRADELNRSRTVPPDFGATDYESDGGEESMMAAQSLPSETAFVAEARKARSSSCSSAGEDATNMTPRTAGQDCAEPTPTRSRNLSEEQVTRLLSEGSPERAPRRQMAAGHGTVEEEATVTPQRDRAATWSFPERDRVTGVPQPQTMNTVHDHDKTNYEVTWTVDARKLNGNDKQVVSPPFTLYFDRVISATFKMMIYPKDRDHGGVDGKGGACFKRSSGQGIIQLKCEGDLSDKELEVKFKLAIGNGSASGMQSPKRPEQPVTHQFSQSAVCGLPKSSNDIWNFKEVVDPQSQTYNVYLSIQTGSSRQ